MLHWKNKTGAKFRSIQAFDYYRGHTHSHTNEQFFTIPKVQRTPHRIVLVEDIVRVVCSYNQHITTEIMTLNDKSLVAYTYLSKIRTYMEMGYWIPYMTVSENQRKSARIINMV